MVVTVLSSYSHSSADSGAAREVSQCGQEFDKSHSRFASGSPSQELEISAYFLGLLQGGGMCEA